MGECNQKHWSVCNRFGIIIPSSGTYFLEVVSRDSLKAAIKVVLDVKKLLKLRILDYFSNAKTEECDQEDWKVFDKFGIMKMGAPISMKAATIASLRVKKTLKT